MFKKSICLVSAFILVLGTFAYAGNYKMTSVRTNEDGETEVTYDDGSVSTFDAGDPYIVSSRDEGEFTIRDYNDGSVSKIYTYQLDAWKQIFKEHKNLYNGCETKTINGKKYITRIKYLETKEWIDLPESEYIEKGENDLTMYLCQIYLANKFFPNQDIYTKSMEYHKRQAENQERIKAQNEAAHEAAEERREALQEKQETHNAELKSKADAKKSYAEASVDAAKNNAIDSSTVSDKTIREYVELYNGKSGVNDPSEKKIGKILKAGYIRVILKDVNYIFDLDGYKAYLDDIYASAKEALDELKGINNSKSQINEIVKRVNNDAKAFATDKTWKKLSEAKSKELKEYVKQLNN